MSEPQFKVIEAEQVATPAEADSLLYLSWSAIQFIKAPAPRLFAWSVIFVVVAFATAGVMSFYVQEDVSIQGAGTTIADVGVRNVVAPTTGFLSQLKIKLDDTVTENQVIGELAMDNMSESEFQSYSAYLNQVLKYLVTAKSSRSVDFRFVGLAQNKIFDSQVMQSLAAIEQNGRILTEAQHHALVGMKSETGPIEARIAFLNKKLNQMKRSAQREFLQTYVESTEEEVGRLNAQVSSSKNLSISRVDQALTNLIQAVRVALAQFENLHNGRLIRAPISGTVARLEVGANTSVTAGQTVAVILPRDAHFVAKIKVNSKDVVKLKIGQPILYKVDAYPYQQYGLFTGTLTSFERIAGVAAGAGSLPSASGESEFLVTGSILPPSTLPLEIQSKLKFVVGMDLHATVVIDRKPMSKIFFERFFLRN